MFFPLRLLGSQQLKGGRVAFEAARLVLNAPIVLARLFREARRMLDREPKVRAVDVCDG